MQSRREDALASAVFAPNQHGGIARRNAPSEVKDTRDGRVATRQIGFGHFATNLIFQVGDPRDQSPHPRHAVQHGADLGGRERLRQVVKRARRSASTAVSNEA